MVSAINAGGIEALRPWPATKRVTIAADRDEGVKPSRPTPSRRGEVAARTFGIRHHGRTSTAIALPGAPGTSTDWLDILRDEGEEAVWAGISDAPAFVPTAAELQAERERVEGLSELQRVERDYPLPKLDSMSLTYQRTASGRIRVHKWAKVGDDLVPQPVTSPFGVMARLRFVDQADAYGLRIVVEDLGGRRREIDVDRGSFAKQAAAETRAMLFGAGLRSEDDGEHIAVKCLKAADPDSEISVVRRPGWHTLGGPEERFFVCPSGRIIGAPEGQPLELSVSSRISETVAVGGSYEGWKDAIAAAVGVPRCEHWTVGATIGFAAPVTSLLGLDTCGLNLSGTTSVGNPTPPSAAASEREPPA